MSTIVLIHGGWHYGERWAQTAEVLRRKGHQVHCPTTGGNRKNDDLTVGHAEACAPIIAYLRDNDLRDVVMVGHSYGGSIISKVAEVEHARISRLVYYNAFVVADGNSVLDEISPVLGDALRVSADERKDGGCFFPFFVWREMFIQDGSLELARQTYELLRPHPIKTLTDKLDLKKFYSLEIPKSFINCTEDMSLGQSPEWCWHPRMSHRLGIFRFVQMPGSHQVMNSNPEGLADSIERASKP